MRCPIAALALLACSLAYSDDANFTIIGGAGNFTKNGYVRMAKEDVRIEMGDETIHVRARFDFVNEGPDTVVTMAFPDETTLEGPSASGDSPSVIRRFRSTVDGMNVKVAKRSIHKSKDPETDISIQSVWLKRVAFAKGQRRTVTVDYTAANGVAGGGMASNSYVLRTGATWKGPIGECSLTVDWSLCRKYGRPALEFEGRRAPKKVRWTDLSATRATTTLTNIEPRYDLDLSMPEGFWNFRVNGQSVSLKLRGWGQADEAFPTGAPRDIQFPVSALGGLFGTANPQPAEWKNPVSKSFGGRMELVDKNHIKLGNQKIIALARPAEGELPGDPSYGLQPTYIYLKDLARALGGNYRYIARWNRVDLWFPPHR